MTRLYLLVEGQTEETFVRDVIGPHYARNGFYITPIIVSTSPGHKGGVVRYAKIKPQLTCLCRQHHAAFVSTFFDLYALPSDFPGKDDPRYPVNGNGGQKAEFLEDQLKQAINESNFIPYLMVHEFETLLFVQLEKLRDWMDDQAGLVKLIANTRGMQPEDINESPESAPSKRIKAAMPAYQKITHGSLVTEEIGLDVMRNACPHFHAWLQKLDRLAGISS